MLDLVQSGVRPSDAADQLRQIEVGRAEVAPRWHAGGGTSERRMIHVTYEPETDPA